MEKKNCFLGIDIGSTTAKLVLVSDGKCIYKKYHRHFSRVRQTMLEMLREMEKENSECMVATAISGSAGMGISGLAGVPFVQEVYATGEAVKRLEPDAGVVIELGGEDAKVIFYEGGADARMNGTCAGGTGAFIDQMAALLDMTVDEMDDRSLKATRIYPIASRCGVFAKTDVQPLVNQGAKKEDIAASIFQAVVNQTVAGLMQGREVRGKVMFLGGPLYYCRGLQKRFCETLGLEGRTAVFPEYGLYAVAIGAAMCAEENAVFLPLSGLIRKLEESVDAEGGGYDRLEPLFSSREEYETFAKRHRRASLPKGDIETYSGKAYLGIDCGSTTTKLVLLSEENSILYTYYGPSKGNPIRLVRERLMEILTLCGNRITIAGSAVTGYGEDLIRHAFHVDIGVVETLAHHAAAKHFQPDVDFILDIGGQDIKCFRLKNGVIDGIMLNEACSSGCGSFIETFANAMGYSAAEFAEKGLLATAPVNLGSRCTVFMNSSVKQAQKDGASVSDISAGLSVSVVKNAIYKVIRANSPKELGKHIVVQGGTFHNDAVLRAFEKEIGAEVVRPEIAGLMGAFGAALYSRRTKETKLLTLSELEAFTHTSSSTVCRGCANGCHLTINRFSDGKTFISGNHCQKGQGKKEVEFLPNVYAEKRTLLETLKPVNGKRGSIGIPLALSTLELAPLWHGLFTQLGFSVRFSPFSTRRTYEKGQFTIPSDTVCYPAKLMHGHILQLIEEGAERIFYPCLTYNVDEGAGDNHFNCPVVAYYAELLQGNMEALKKVQFLYPYLSLDSPKLLAKTLYPTVKEIDETILYKEVLHAVKAGFKAYKKYREEVRKAGENAIHYARENGKRILILAGRPYHIDPEISHGIDSLCGELGFVVVSEDSVCHLAPKQQVDVLDQWTFHARLYRAARYAADHADTSLVQLVSFGCGVDAITTDEVGAILERNGKYYTQIKIDEITNLGAVRIRLRSLIGALEESGNAE